MAARSHLKVLLAVSAAVLASVFAVSFSASSGQTQDAPRSVSAVADPVLEDRLATIEEGASSRAILTFEERPTAAQVERVKALGAAVHTFDVLPMLGVRGTEAEVQRLLSMNGLVSAYSDRKLEYLMRESRPLIGADRVGKRLGFTGQGIGVATIDSGVDGTHPDLTLGEELVQNAKIVGAPAPDDGASPLATVVEDQPTTDTSSGHGTHVTGTVGGSGQTSGGYYKGVAPKADLVGIGAGDALFILYALEGFDYALENRKEYNIQVISNSWGTTGRFDRKDPVNVASKIAHDRGVSVVFAAGNEGPGKNTLNPYSVAPWVIGVAAGDKQRRLASFSSRGRPGSGLYAPDITAPGVNIVSARSKTGAFINALAAADDANYIPPRYVANYTTASGTSMATPHVAGTIALMEDANPSLTPDRALKALTSTTTDMPGRARYEVGAGYLNAFRAVQAVR